VLYINDSGNVLSVDKPLPLSDAQIHVAIHALSGGPSLLGTDMHILMGEVEIEDCAWDATTMTLSGSALRPAGEKGSVYVHAPETLRVANPQGLWIAKDARDKTLVIRAALEFPEGSADWCIRFAPLSQVLDMNKLDLKPIRRGAKIMLIAAPPTWSSP
jgi:hypothetical protein